MRPDDGGIRALDHAAQRLYARLGYLVVGTLKDYVVAGHDEILLRKTSGPLDAFAASGKTGSRRRNK